MASTPTYDSANRLISIQNQQSQIENRYSGLGDRLQETVNGVTTTFTMDLNTGLTQALSDGTNTYLYGNGRIAQYNTTAEYFLGDALGSVRQLTDQNGAVTLARAYDPYGVVTQTAGAGASSYGYTNEYQSQGLVYLRARHYAPGMGRFMSRDTWAGDANSPMSFNRWNYADANPITRTDPSGNCYVIEDGDGVWYPDSSVKCLYTPGSLGHHPDTTPFVKSYGGLQLLQIYLSMKDCDNAWWNRDVSIVFDHKTLVGLMILAEANFMFDGKDPKHYPDDIGKEPTDIIRHGPNADKRTKALVDVIATNLFDGGGRRNWKCDQTRSGLCLAKMLNYWAAYSEEAKDLINDYFHPDYITVDGGNPKPTGGYDRTLNDWLSTGPVNVATYSKTKPQAQYFEILNEANKLGQQAFDPGSAVRPNGPTEYGNESDDFTNFVSDYVKPDEFHGTDISTVYYYVQSPNDNSWFVWNTEQETNWRLRYAAR